MRRIILGFLGFIVVIIAAAWLTLKRDDISYAELESRYAFEASKYVTLENGVRAHYLDVGPRDTEKTLLMVHGFSSSTHTWADWIRALEAEYRIVAIDLPVHGLTEAPLDYQPSIEAFVEHVETMAAALDLEKFTLIGSPWAATHPGNTPVSTQIAWMGWCSSVRPAGQKPRQTWKTSR